ncbi:hypothetical protein [Undibacterium griseum]|uniref:DUF1579 domain-containing protein n=1 Tax=Undibacterium griseum TaxID=2762295 RepID=A0ABR6YJ39_9BURK|nr:hypothetical protein [Undibacterium griseum]MBC3883874.1 hypothetical protein [Undibacterium griseum]
MNHSDNIQPAQQAFDFFIGHWHIENQRLTRRLQSATEWEHFSATQTVCQLPGGIGNYDDFSAPDWRPGFVGMSLRIFNPVTACWSIYWLDNQSGGLDGAGILTPPVVGRFHQGTGIFEGDDMLDGKPVRVRYTWSDITADSAKWEQAMSDDGGANWETNWRMQMRRIK